ncbi:phenylacetate--CoA ligase family protein [Arthrobacter alpinus]|uniref:phenylacetate--CoA ligase family protein n=1 Tax=Arthrobacter alpinus TaxID=656366 RepID=UPI0016466B74|nr:phenylacetate--CoA ligase family protein [Arthrobacter alpinus]
MPFRRTAFKVKVNIFLPSDKRMYLDLMRSQTLPDEDLKALQMKRSLDQAQFAMEHTPFYRDLYTAAGITMRDFRDPEIFTNLPIVDKSDVRDYFEFFKSSEATSKNSIISTTGGSTGEPLRILRDLRTPTRTLEWRLFDWWGVHPSENVAVVTRQSRDSRAAFSHDIKSWPSKRFQLNAYRMDELRIDEFLENWRRISPTVLVGYVGAISELARILESRGIQPTSPRAIAVTAAPITPAQRLIIETVFGAPVYDHYRSSEIPWIAGECKEQNGLHIFSDVRKIEILKETGELCSQGEVGEVVATDLTNRVFPLVRYRLGDRTTPMQGVCPCGVNLPRISAISGRVSDALHLPGGEVIAGEALTQTFRNAPSAVRQFQVHQQSDFSIVVRCVPGSADDAKSLIHLAVDEIRTIVMNKVLVSLEIVDNIPHDGGKVRFIKSDVL